MTLVILGALVGYQVRQNFLVSFEAKTALPLAVDLAVFRAAEPLLSSPEAIRRYASKQSAERAAELETVREQFSQSASGPFRFEHAFRITKRDLREVPDSKGDISKLTSPGVQSDVQVVARAQRPDSAIRMADLALGYLRNSLAEASLRNLMQLWGPGARTDFAKEGERIAKLRSDVASSDRRIESMEKLQAKLQGEKETYGSPTSAASVQVQITGTRNLAPLQQIVGFETDRSESLEKLRLAENEQVRLQTLIRYSDLIGKQINDGAALSVAKEVLREASNQIASVPDTANPVQSALATVALQMQTILSSFEETKAEPERPEARPVGPSRLAIAGIGATAGAAIWLLILLAFGTNRRRGAH